MVVEGREEALRAACLAAVPVVVPVEDPSEAWREVSPVAERAVVDRTADCSAVGGPVASGGGAAVGASEASAGALAEGKLAALTEGGSEAEQTAAVAPQAEAEESHQEALEEGEAVATVVMMEARRAVDAVAGVKATQEAKEEVAVAEE